MKNLLLVPFILVAMVTPAYVVSQHKQVITKQVPVMITKTVTKTVAAEVPSYRIGDTQDGVTLVGMYPYSYQNMMGGNGDTPPTTSLVYFALAGASNIAGRTQVLTDSGAYLVTDGPTNIPACGENPCVGYIAIGKPAAFYYQGMRWEL